MDRNAVIEKYAACAEKYADAVAELCAIAEKYDEIRTNLEAARKEAVIAWSVCASIHREYGKGRDPLYSTRQGDFVKRERDARVAMHDGCCPLCGGDCAAANPPVTACPMGYGS